MQFNDVTNKQGIVQHIDFLLGTTNSSYPIADKTRNANITYDDVAYMIMTADGSWQYDDDNQTDLPIGTTDLVAGQNNYNIPAVDFLEIVRVEVCDANGNWHQLDPFDYNDNNGHAMTYVDPSGGGMPRYYNKVGSSLILYATPNFSVTGGLRVYYKRNVLLFEEDDTTKEPGFNRQFHVLIAIGAAMPYCIPNGLEKKLVSLKKDWAEISAKLIKFYSWRGKDKKINIRPARSSTSNDVLRFLQ